MVVESVISDNWFVSEIFVSFYDIFVRNAFGNYRAILREISYNPLMAENLSYLRSKSSAHMFATYRIKSSAGERTSTVFFKFFSSVSFIFSLHSINLLVDENFAREIMQLFTMGIIQLNMDGSPKLDDNGNTMLAYTNGDIMSLSRAWTGFDTQPYRGNIEGDNRVDPMRINAQWRDRFPKTDTTGGYIGDDYPLCNDFPSKSFLRKGAKYRLLGGSNLPELMDDPVEFAGRSETVKLHLDETSPLRSLLCNENNVGQCDYRIHVTLQTNFDCTGIECDVDTVRVVEVEPGIFYEFVPPPCVTFSFYSNPVKISPRLKTDASMCADPTLPVASEACCIFNNSAAQRNSKYSGERMMFMTADNRCNDISMRLCGSIGGIEGEEFLSNGYFWTTDSCLLQVKVKRDGSLTIVHKPKNFAVLVEHVSVINENYFDVLWEGDGDYPTVDNNCDEICEVLSGGECLCGTGVLENTVFNGIPSSKAEVIEKLHVGALNPSTFDSDTYTSVVGNNGDFIAHLKENEFSAETIFEYEDDKGRTFYMKNIHSSVHLRDLSGHYVRKSFRNAPQFMSFIPTETNVR